MCMVMDYAEKQGRDLGMKEGLDLGRQQGMDLGIRQGMKQGLSQGIKEGRFLQLCDLVQTGIITMEQAAGACQLTVKEFQKKMEKYQN